MRDIDNFYLYQEEPNKSCLLYLREHILAFDENITEAWKYSMPFFCYKGKMFCYLWTHKKLQIPFIGVVDGKLLQHPLLIHEGRARIKIMVINPEQDMPVAAINEVLNLSLKYHR